MRAIEWTLATLTAAAYIVACVRLMLILAAIGS